MNIPKGHKECKECDGKGVIEVQEYKDAPFEYDMCLSCHGEGIIEMTDEEIEMEREANIDAEAELNNEC